MYRLIEYTILFLVMVILQVFLFSRVGISVYVNPLVYVAFIVLLPMEIAGALLLLVALLMGVSMDFFMGTAGINTIATLFVAFCRPAVLNLMIGKDEIMAGGVPNVNLLGIKKFFRYATVMVVMHSSVFFLLESLSWQQLPYTVLRIMLSSAITLVLVYYTQKMFSVNRQVH